MDVPCDCMVIQQSDGSEMCRRCRRCRGDIYGCDCPMVHTRRCGSEFRNPVFFIVFQVVDTYRLAICDHCGDFHTYSYYECMFGQDELSHKLG